MISISVRPILGGWIAAMASITLASLGSAQLLEAQAPPGAQVRVGAVPPPPTMSTYIVETTGLASRLVGRLSVPCSGGSPCYAGNPGGTLPGDTLEFTLYVKNTGMTPATQVPWSLTVDGALLPSGGGAIASLAAGVTVTVRARWIATAPGNHAVAGTTKSPGAVKVNQAPDNLTTKTRTVGVRGTR